MKTIQFDKCSHSTDPFFSPDTSCNDGLSFTINAQESVMILVPYNQRRIRLIKNKFYITANKFKICFIIKNITNNQNVLVKSGDYLSTLFTNSCLQHRMCHTHDK